MTLPLTTLVEYQDYRYLIMDAPNDLNVHLYVAEMKKVQCTQCVRVCQQTYKASAMAEQGIEVHELPFADGKPPPDDVLDRWLAVVIKNVNNKVFEDKESKRRRPGAIAVHCIAGLGRAPMMVAIALVEIGLHYTEAVELIRKSRRKAINAKQLEYLRIYRRRTGHAGCCVIA